MPPLAREASQPTNLALPYACSSPIRKLLTASHKYAPALPTFGASQLTMVGHNKKNIMEPLLLSASCPNARAGRTGHCHPSPASVRSAGSSAPLACKSVPSLGAQAVKQKQQRY
ncbi:hypothetical protein PVAP13_6KG125505 [Panicum virgatum]|uniref:Uncharacterized protein n=1 Tax=Panicum virgatum TaxID=38727 RepID=A0A8T0R8Z8_PANVG|nr:hypothetical protein PVAP13_6KG125505 [Panicum virgatum]KAG2582273.1 hypothetical protein PVAP13_6KG125505 [Panicum virgatum]